MLTPKTGGTVRRKNYLWIGSLLAVASCGGRSSLDPLEMLSSGGRAGASGDGQPSGGGGAMMLSGGPPIVAGAFGTGGTAGSSGAFPVGGAAGTPSGGAADLCTLPAGDCATSADMSCQGQRPNCSGEFSLDQQLDAEYLLQVTDIAVSGEGRVAVTGYFRGIANIGGIVIDSDDDPSTTRTAPFVLSFDHTGTLEWAYAYQSKGNYGETVIAFAPNGDLMMHMAAINWSPGAALVRLDRKGQILWGEAWGKSDHISPSDIAVGSDGRIWATGTFVEQLDKDGVSLSTQAASSCYLLLLAADGTAQKAIDVAPKGAQFCHRTNLAVDVEGSVHVVGYASGSDDKELGFYEKYSSRGSLEYTKLYVGNVRPSSVAVDQQGRATVFATYEGTFVNDGRTFAAEPVNASNPWLAQYARTGELNWQKSYTGDVLIEAGAADPFGNVILSGNGSVLVVDGKTIKSQHLPENGNVNFSFVLKLRSDGGEIWVRRVDGGAWLRNIGVDNAGNIWGAASFGDQAWVNDSKHVAMNPSSLLVRLAP